MIQEYIIVRLCCILSIGMYYSSGSSDRLISNLCFRDRFSSVH
jgi:hypothetical protein